MRTGDGLNRLILTGLSDYAGVVPESIPVGVIDELRATLFLLLRPLENRLPARRFDRGGCNRLILVEATTLEILNLGLYLLDGIRLRDYGVIQALVLLFSMSIMLINLVVDISYVLIDPRISRTLK